MPFAVVPPCFLLPTFVLALALPQGGAPLQTTHTIGTQCDPSPSCVFTTIEYSLYAARSFFEPGILLLHVFLKNFKKSAGAFAFSDVLVLPISPQNMLRTWRFTTQICIKCRSCATAHNPLCMCQVVAHQVFNLASGQEARFTHGHSWHCISLHVP